MTQEKVKKAELAADDPALAAAAPAVPAPAQGVPMSEVATATAEGCVCSSTHILMYYTFWYTGPKS